MIAISDRPIDVAAVLAAVADPRAGGHGLFVGTVRDDDGGRAVLGLTYEAHPDAERTMREICTDPTVLRIAAVHRTGELGIGDVAVVVAVSAVHRAEALDTTRRLIDAIKSQVPIWKHQRFADGTDEWVGAC